MIAPAISGIAAVVGGNNQTIVHAHCLLDFRNPAVQALQSSCVALAVPPMPPQHVKIHKVYKNKSLRSTLQGSNRLVDGFRVAVSLQMLADADEVEN